MIDARSMNELQQKTRKNQISECGHGQEEAIR